MKYKVLTWVLMVTMLVGQSYAYALVPCESQMVDTNQQHHDMQVMQHSEHDMMSEPNNDMPCCDQERKCPPGTCASVALNQAFKTHSINKTSTASSFYVFSIQDTYLGSLSKPPIFS